MNELTKIKLEADAKEYFDNTDKPNMYKPGWIDEIESITRKETIYKCAEEIAKVTKCKTCPIDCDYGTEVGCITRWNNYLSGKVGCNGRD